MKAAILLALLALASAQLQATVTVPASGTSSAVSFTGVTGTLINGVLSAGGSTTFSTTSSTAVAVTLTASLAASVTGFANLGTTNGISLSGGLLASLGNPLQLAISASGTGTLTLNIYPATVGGVSVTATGSTQLHLFTNTGVSADTSATVYGAVQAQSIANGGISYTFNLPLSNQQFVFGQLSQSSFSIGSNSAGDATAFSSNSYIPVAYNTAFNFAAGTQYQVGSSLYIAAQQATSFSVNTAATFSSSNSAPATTYGSIGYGWQINSAGGNNGNTVLKWTGSSSTFVGGSNTTANAATVAASAAWYKSTSASASAGAWVRQASSSRVEADGRITVTAQANTFSQWTVGASGSASGLQITMALVFVAALLSVAF